MSVPLELWDAFIAGCAPAFTQPSFELFEELLSAWVLCPLLVSARALDCRARDYAIHYGTLRRKRGLKSVNNFVTTSKPARNRGGLHF